MERTWARWKEGTSFNWTIEAKETGAFIGRILIKTHADTQDWWTIGFWVHPEHQNHGYATECALAILQFGFGTLNADTIVSGHAKWNHASGTVLNKIGMRRTGETAEGYLKQGEWVAVYDYAISREEYRARRRS